MQPHTYTKAMGKTAAMCSYGLFFCFNCRTKLFKIQLISTPHLHSLTLALMSSGTGVAFTLGAVNFVQAAFWSHYVTIVDTLKPSSCLASSDTCQLLSSLSLVHINTDLGFSDTIVSCFSSSLPHSSLVTALLCLPPRICPLCALSPSTISSSWRWS